MLMICSGVKGATLYIDNLEGLFESEEGLFSSISISNLDIDGEFWVAFSKINRDELQFLSFNRCKFEEFSFLNNFTVSELSMTDCQLSDQNLLDISQYIPYTISSFNLTGNALGKNKDLFKEAIGKLDDHGCKLVLNGNSKDSELSAHYKGKSRIRWVS